MKALSELLKPVMTLINKSKNLRSFSAVQLTIVMTFTILVLRVWMGSFYAVLERDAAAPILEMLRGIR